MASNYSGSAFVDRRGGQIDYETIPSTGWLQNFEVVDASEVAVDLTNRTFEMVVVDERSESSDYSRGGNSKPIKKTYTFQPDVGTGGTFTAKIPATDHDDLWGQEVVYSITSTLSGGETTPFVWGIMRFEETR